MGFTMALRNRPNFTLNRWIHKSRNNLKSKHSKTGWPTLKFQFQFSHQIRDRMVWTNRSKLLGTNGNKNNIYRVKMISVFFIVLSRAYSWVFSNYINKNQSETTYKRVEFHCIKYNLVWVKMLHLMKTMGFSHQITDSC